MKEIINYTIEELHQIPREDRGAVLRRYHSLLQKQREQDRKEMGRLRKNIYRVSEKGRETYRKARKKYQQSEKGRETSRKASKKYYQSKKGRNIQKDGGMKNGL